MGGGGRKGKSEQVELRVQENDIALESWVPNMEEMKFVSWLQERSRWRGGEGLREGSERGRFPSSWDPSILQKRKQTQRCLSCQAIK